MKRYLALFVPLLILTGCATRSSTTLPTLSSLQGISEINNCSQIFPQEPWQFVHSIHFTRHSDNGTNVMGITVVSQDMLKTALVTVEGLTLFAADFYPDGSFQVHRTVPPFDSPNFAKGMMRDIRTIFLLPDGKSRYGQTVVGHPVCRYTDSNDRVTDVELTLAKDKDDCWQITRYTPDHVRELSIIGRFCTEKGTVHIPESLELQTYGRTGYTLKMKLISAERL